MLESPGQHLASRRSSKGCREDELTSLLENTRPNSDGLKLVDGVPEEAP